MTEAVLAAAAPLLAAAFTLWGSPVTWAEVVAFVLAVWMVVCNWRVNPLAWPLAIASSLLYALLFADARLYGMAGLQFFFVAVALWGWWQWLRGRGDDGAPLRVRRLTARGRVVAAGATLAMWPLLALFLQHATDSRAPWLDALPTVGSVTGQVLLGRKLVENWPVWIAVNLVSVALFVQQALWLTVILYALFAAMAVVGWRAWARLAALQATSAREVGHG
jgi:nicotinamide mononucleotide transporter